MQVPGEAYKIAGIQESVEVRPQEALLSELQAFVASCHGERAASHPGVEAGLAAMRVCDEIQRAVKK